MARIRSIKPSFFTNEDLAELSLAHRLCFAGLWCFADREGRLEDRPRRLKAAIFPYDDVDMDALLNGLHDKGFILRYAADGAAYIAVVQFLRHQRPKADEAVSLIPAPRLDDPRGKETAPRIGEGHKDIGTEDRGEGIGADVAPPAADGADSPLSMALAFQASWNSLTALPIPRCKNLTSTRKRHVRARLTERALAEWENVMQRIQGSRFCRGENDRGWAASFDWLIGSPDVGVKVLEGKYDDRDATKPKRAIASQESPRLAYDWFEECKAIHAGACELDRYRHMTRMQMEAGKDGAA